jgi:nitrogenase cofactor biosynthesis protein NifB
MKAIDKNCTVSFSAVRGTLEGGRIMINCRGCKAGSEGKDPLWGTGLSNNTINKTLKHPCFNKNAHDCARIHLPVAPACNIKCKFCNRKYDCQNESRPGVTSNLLTPEEALKIFEHYRKRLKNLTVMGIAGPGDALANFDNVKKTIGYITEDHSDIAICISTNGLMLPEYAMELKKMGISHITVTINAVDPAVSEKIYDYVDYKGKRFRGREASEILLKNQLLGLEIIKDLDIMCKVNIVAIKGVNYFHVKDIVKKVKSLGVTYTNIMSLIPVKDTDYENHEPLSNKEISNLRKECEDIVPQMCHCRQCRADAVGKLGDELPQCAI